MNISVRYVTARSATLELADGGRFYTCEPYDIRLNGKHFLRTDRVITNLFGLFPGQACHVQVCPADSDTILAECDFTTGAESVTLNVRDFGAVGDGQTDDTLAIQTAVLVCPPQGRVLVPAGTYCFRCLILKSDLQLYLDDGAVLSAFTDEDKLPLLPGMIQTTDEKDDYNLGTWEGNPLPSRIGIVSAFYAERILVYGPGRIDGGASRDNWWRKERVKVLPGRPRLLFLHHCKDVTIQGVTFTNSPSWTLHPYFCTNVSFLGTEVNNPQDSPNTDGMDPESVTDLLVLGMRFSLGDDCIAIKAGKIYMASRYHTPSRHIQIRQCLMEHGHGAVTIGSEMAGGVYGVTVEDCLFRDTDRGLRVKTRRGRGKEAVLEDIVFRNITMDQVRTPIAVNSFYYCDPDGHTSYVQNREALPVDDRTPAIRSLVFSHVKCENCHVQAAYVEGLPEQKIDELVLDDVSFSFAEDAQEGLPVMTEGVDLCSRKGIFVSNVHRLTMKKVRVTGQEGHSLTLGSVK
ncbi:MAG: glycoside hydrolase family 28 protein [Blautia sp.]|nr:glycoside hydrolase family 28 protein [Blautia sp.]